MLRSQLLKGVLDIAVLAILQQEPSYGYAILERMEEAGLRDVGDASVYGTLRRLEDAGFLRSRTVPSDAGPPRRYFELTAAGREMLEKGVKEWSQVDQALSRLLGGRMRATR